MVSWQRWLWLLGLVLSLTWTGVAQAGQLTDRVAVFPDWQNRPPVTAAQGDLVYPDWMVGTWQVESPLVDAVAPLAPEIVTPGFAAQAEQLNEMVTFRVRFGPQAPRSRQRCSTVANSSFSLALPPPLKLQNEVVADRAFNGLEIGRAYLGENAIASVMVDPCQPNRQITRLKSAGRLIATVTDRASETPNTRTFVATELTNQVFRFRRQVYVNDVETTTAYQLQNDGSITADQITAIYLSPQDPDYFRAGDRPVALYRYQLTLHSIPAR